MRSKKGFSQIIMVVLGLVLGAILIGAVAFPITRTVMNATSLNTSSWGGSADTSIVNIMPTLVLIGLLVLIAVVGIMGVVGKK